MPSTQKTNSGGDIMIVCLYVDDMIFTGNNHGMFDDFKKIMTNEFEMTDIGQMAYFLGVEVKQSKDGIFMSQRKVCGRDFKEIQNGGMQASEHTSRNKHKAQN